VGSILFGVPIGYCVKTCMPLNRGALIQGCGSSSGKECGLFEFLTKFNNFFGVLVRTPYQLWLTCKGDALSLQLAALSANLRMKMSGTLYGVVQS
jgi:hypothetical protein